MFPQLLVILLGAIVVGLAYSPFATATDYYVSPSGIDANDGKTPQTAWQSLEKLSKALHAGDRGFLEGGQTFKSILRINSGTAEIPVIIDSYGSGRARISVDEQGQGSLSMNSNTDALLKNLELHAPKGYGAILRKEGTGSRNIIFDNVTFCGGIEGFSSANVNDQEITIHNCTFEKCGGNTIAFFGKGPITLKGNRIKGNGKDAAIKLYGTQKAVIEENEVENGNAPLIEVKPKISFYIADRNSWKLPKMMHSSFLGNGTAMSLPEWRRWTGQHANDNKPGAGPSQSPQAAQTPTTPNQPIYQTPQGLVDPRTMPNWNSLNKFVQWQVWTKYTNSLEQLKQKR